MKKRFNVTGACHPGQHYMADTSAKFARVLDMVEQGDYFTINRPRQYGKTTTLFGLVEALKKREDYVVFRISFEGVGDAVFESETAFAPMFFRRLAQYLQHSDKTLAEYLQAASLRLDGMETLAAAISDLVAHCNKKVALLIDEVDKSSNNQLFVSFLGMLRDKYLERMDTPTFHSVILTGVHDVKNLKLRLRPDEERKYNSPWNIAADFDVDMNFHPHEIRPMLEEYARDREVQLDAQAVAARLFYYTSGHPFLVSKLCKIFDEKLLPEKTERAWTAHDVDVAARQLAGESNTNFDELSKNLDNNEDLYQLTQSIALGGEQYPFNVNDPVASLGVLYGIFANRNGLAIHNRIYQEVIVSKMSFRVQRENQPLLNRYGGVFGLPGNRLDVQKALLKFQELMRAEHSGKDRDFLEREGRLVFLAFLKPILNGHGYALKEPQISEEKRLDVLITYHEHRYVIELKRWYGPAAHERGLDQLTGYLDSLGMGEGFLIIFDHSGTKQWKEETSIHAGKQLFAVWT